MLKVRRHWPASQPFLEQAPDKAGPEGLGKAITDVCHAPQDSVGRALDQGSGLVSLPPPKISPQDSAEFTQTQQHSKSSGFTLTCASLVN